MSILRYLGVAKENNGFGVKSLPPFHNDITSGGLDSPADPFIKYDGGLGRLPRRKVAGVYKSSGSIEFAIDVSTLWYFLWLALGTKAATDTAGVIAIDDEAIGTTDVDGALADSLANPLVNMGSFIISNATPIVVAMDDGSGVVRAVSAVANEAVVTGVGETTKTVTLANQRIVPGTWVLELVATDKAHDDGAGVIVADGGSGIAGTIDYVNGVVYLTGLLESTSYNADYSKMGTTKKGTINYITGVFSLTGLAAEIAHTADYSYGYNVHVITPSNELTLPSATYRLCKDIYEHIFAGGAISQLTLKVERELATIAIDVEAGKDEKGTVLTEPNIYISPEFPMPFHDVQFKYGDYLGALSDISANVQSITLTIKNNLDTDQSIGLNSRFPQSVRPGNLDIALDIDLRFDDTGAKEDFWGGASEPSETPTEKASQIILDAGSYGSIILDIPRGLIGSVDHKPSGRKVMTQPIKIEILRDSVSDTLMTATASVLNDWK